MRPWYHQREIKLGVRAQRGKWHCAREALIRVLERNRAQPVESDVFTPDHTFYGEAAPVGLPPNVERFLAQIKTCSVYVKRGQRHRRQYCGHSLCPYCNNAARSNSVQRKEGVRAWNLIQGVTDDPRQYWLLTVNLDQDPRRFIDQCERFRTVMRRIVTKHDEAILTGPFELNVTKNQHILLHWHGWLICPAETAQRIKADCKTEFRGRRDVQIKPMKPDGVRRNFQRGISYSAKLPLMLFKFIEGVPIDPLELIRFIDAFEVITPGQGRRALRVEIGTRSEHIPVCLTMTALNGFSGTPKATSEVTPLVSLLDPHGNSGSSTSWFSSPLISVTQMPQGMTVGSHIPSYEESASITERGTREFSEDTSDIGLGDLSRLKTILTLQPSIIEGPP
jgi:hypothetical protein